MAFLAKLKSFAKSNWTFGTLILIPLFRLLWRVFIGDTSSGKKSPSSATPREGDAYKKGDVIDVEVKK